MEGNLMMNCALCWLLFETICCLFSFKVWNVRKRSLFFLFSLTSSPLGEFLPLYWLCPSHTMLCWNNVKGKTWIPRKKAWYLEWDMSSNRKTEALQQSRTASGWGVSEIALLGQALPWDVNYPIGDNFYALCSKHFIQQQFIISRRVICGYNLDCPANCWMPEEAGECAAAGCVGSSLCVTARAGGWVFKMPWDPDTICYRHWICMSCILCQATLTCWNSLGS